ncbi:MAG: redoxin domain-containing protein [Deltaproteobacteria bacterium]
MKRNALLLATLFILAALHFTFSPLAESKVAQGAPASDFELLDQNGKTVKLSDYDGKIVVLEWTNPDCPFVQRHYKSKTMTTLAEKYGKDVAWLAVNSTRYMDVNDNKNWAASYGVAYPILDDHAGNVGKRYSAQTTPHLFILDKSRKVVYEGAIDDDPSGSSKAPLNYVDRALGEVASGRAVLVSETKPYGCSVKYAN